VLLGDDYKSRYFASEYEGAQPEEVRAYGAFEDRASTHPLENAAKMHAQSEPTHHMGAWARLAKALKGLAQLMGVALNGEPHLDPSPGLRAQRVSCRRGCRPACQGKVNAIKNALW
jgi:hypothetical protein